MILYGYVDLVIGNMTIKTIYQSVQEMWLMYKTYEIYKIHRPYTLSGIRNSIKLLKLYLDKENNA